MTAVPAAWAGWVSTAARNTGLPDSVVAAQINLESGFQTNVTSSAGAEGPAQFEPPTWASLGIAGSPYDPKAALQGYSKYMGQLLRQYHGNVRNALAAYNAGGANIAAGYGYADRILKAAGQPVTITAGSGSSSSATVPGGISGSYGGLSGFLLRAVLTIALLAAGLAIAFQGINGIFAGAPKRAARKLAVAA